MPDRVGNRGTDTKKGRHLMKNLLSAYNTRKGRNNKSFSGTVRY